MLMPTCSRQTLVKDHAFLVKPAYYLKSLYGVRGFCVCDISVVQVYDYQQKMQNIIAVNDEMITVKKANTARKKMTARQLNEYLKNVEPFQLDGRWGLMVTEQKNNRKAPDA